MYVYKFRDNIFLKRNKFFIFENYLSRFMWFFTKLQPIVKSLKINKNIYCTYYLFFFIKKFYDKGYTVYIIFQQSIMLIILNIKALKSIFTNFQKIVKHFENVKNQ